MDRGNIGGSAWISLPQAFGLVQIGQREDELINSRLSIGRGPLTRIRSCY